MGGAVTSPRPAMDDEARRAALRAGAPKVPRRAVLWALLAATVLTFGGILGEHLVSVAGLNPVGGPSPTTTTTTTTDPGSPSAASALLGFTALAPLPTPAVTLRDQHGVPVDLAGLRGDVVVLTFFDATCRDACDVIAAELKAADRDLGRAARHVELLTLNTDPKDLGTSPAPAAVTDSGLDALENWHWLTGPLSVMNGLWDDFGVSISVYEPGNVAVHNDVIYLVDPAGFLVERGSPFSDLSRDGVTTLPAPLERVAGRVLAERVAALLATGPR